MVEQVVELVGRGGLVEELQPEGAAVVLEFVESALRGCVEAEVSSRAEMAMESGQAW